MRGYEFELIEKLCEIGLLGHSVDVIGGISYGERNDGNCDLGCQTVVVKG